MKKILLALLGIIVVAGILAGAGFAGYRIGYNHGALASADGTVQLAPMGRGFGMHGIPMHNFNPGFERGFDQRIGPGDFDMLGRGGGMRFDFFSPFHFIIRLAVFGLIIWLAYKLFTGNGWKLSLTRQTVENPKVEPAPTEKTE
jgi:hypothetical protein